LALSASSDRYPPPNPLNPKGAMFRQSTIWLMRGALALATLVLLLALGLGFWARLWLGDHLDSFRPRIEAAVSEKAKIQAHVGKLEVIWHGLLPEFILKDLELKDDTGLVDLSLEQVNVRLALLSLINGNIDFAALDIHRPKLNIQRRADGRFLLAGILLPLSSDEPGIPFLDWLLNQQELGIHDGVVNWEDQLMHSPVAKFPQVELHLQGRGDRHRFKLTFTAPAHIMRNPEFNGDFHGRDSQHFAEWSGTFGASADFIDLAGLRHLLPLPEKLQTKLDKWAPTGVIQALKASWNVGDNRKGDYNLQARFTDLSMMADQKWPGVAHLSGAIQADQSKGHIDLDGQNYVMALDAYFDHPLSLHHIQASAHWEKKGNATLITLDQCKVEDPEVLGHVEGTLQLDEQGHRMAHLRASIDRAEVSSVGKFLPTDIGQDARNWIKTSLRSGQSRLATMELEGDLHAFPFATPQAGTFKVHVPLEDVRLDYASNWPVLTGVRGALDFDGVAVTIRGTEASQGSLVAREILGKVPDLDAEHPVLELEAKVRGPVQSGLDFIAASPLKKSIGSLPKLFKASGIADVGLKIHVPLDQTDATTVVGNLVVDGAELRNDTGDIPPMSAIKGRLQFTENGVSADGLSAKVLGGMARASITTIAASEAVLAPVAPPSKQGHPASQASLAHSVAVVVEAGGQFDHADVNHFYMEDKLNFLKGKGEWKGRFKVIDGHTDLDIHALAPIFGQASEADIQKHGSDPLSIDLHGKPALRSVLQEFAPVLIPAAEGNLDWNVSFKRTNNSDALSGSGRFVLLGKSGEVLLSGRPDAFVLEISGGMDAKALDRIIPRLPKSILTGSANWQATLDERPGQVFFKLNSDLKGVSLDLPAPFGKGHSDALPLLVRINRKAPNASAVLTGYLDSVLAFTALIPASDKEEIKRVAIKLGSKESPSLPSTNGIQLSGDLVNLDIDAWKKILRSHPIASATHERTSMSDLPIYFDMKTQKASFGRYRLGAHHVVGQYSSAGMTFESHGSNLEGTIEWSSEGPGHLNAKLDQLILRSDPLLATGKTLALDPSDDPRQLPIFDLKAGKVDFDQRQIGQVEMHAEPDTGGWKISKLTITQPHGLLQAQGNWTLRAGQTHTTMSGEIQSSDTGLFLQDLGYPKALARGKTSLHAQLDWPGDPGDFVVANLNGSMELNSQSGQFLTVEPGVGRLIGLLSLQSLPRRITLDFRDIFSEGFAFDSLAGHIDVKQGVLSTQNLKMKGPAASVVISGKASVVSETAEMNVKVSPAVGNSVSFASTLVGGPVVGAATYLLQRLLSNPIDQLLTYDYQVTGPWEDPKVNRIGDNKNASKTKNDNKAEQE